jgi:hypothetical protein
MTFPRARLAVAATLFVAWLGYLFSLVLLSWHTVVLSRPQFLVTNLCVVADLSDAADGKPARTVKIDQVFWSNRPADLKGAKIEIANLADAAPQGYSGPGKYILPLQEKLTKAGPVYRIAVVPSSPRYEPAFVDVVVYAVGADKERAIRLASEFLGLSDADARASIDRVAADKQPVTLARHVATEQYRLFRDGLPSALIEAASNDVRIYPVTAETLEQLEEIVKTR